MRLEDPAASRNTWSGSLLFEGVDQIDLTGPFEVLSRLLNATYRIFGKTLEPVRDARGLRLTPDALLEEAPKLDVLHSPQVSWLFFKAPVVCRTFCKKERVMVSGWK